MSDAVDAALNNPSAADGFRDLIFDLCALQAADPGRRALLTTAFPASSLIEQRAAETVEKVGEVIERAHRDGAAAPGRRGG